MQIYVGKLSRRVTEEDLRHAFEVFGQVASVIISREKRSGRSMGFGFVEMPIEVEALAAISCLHGKELKGGAIFVNKAL